MKINKFILLLCIACFIMPCQNSMAFWGSKKKAPTVKLTTEGRIYVGEKYTGLSKLVAQLKANKVKPETRIRIEIPKNTSPQAISSISRELIKHGYLKFVFNKPQEATAEKGLDPILRRLGKKPVK